MKTFLTLLSLFFCLTLSAQGLTVESFKENTQDTSAKEFSRNDNNGVPCALIKVELASSSAKFEGTVMGKVEYKTSEYWVYMPKGSKRLNVKLENYLPLLVEFEPLESNVTYVLTISGMVENNQMEEVRTKMGWIIFDTEPQGANVYIKDSLLGKTPLDNCKLPYGTYDYRVEMPNYYSASGTFELKSNQFEKTIQLEPVSGSISVDCNISEAKVFLDGNDTDKKAPCTLTEVPIGFHVVSFQKEKYVPTQFNVTVEDGKEVKVEGKLKKEKIKHHRGKHFADFFQDDEYIKERSFYINGVGGFGSLTTAGGNLGYNWPHFNAEFGVQKIFTKFPEYNDCSYSGFSFSLLIGVPIKAGRFQITPQVGVMGTNLTLDSDDVGTTTSGLAGIRTMLAISNHIGIFLNPTYRFNAMLEEDNPLLDFPKEYKKTYQGFQLELGLTLFFGKDD